MRWKCDQLRTTSLRTTEASVHKCNSDKSVHDLTARAREREQESKRARERDRVRERERERRREKESERVRERAQLLF